MMAYILPRLAAAICGLIVCLVLGELGLRLLFPEGSGANRRLPLPYPYERIERLGNGETWITFDPDLGWVNSPGFDRVSSEGHYRHNQQGLRADREYSPTPAAGIARIAAYGDSFTYCSEVRFEDCWTPRLEELLSNSEVLNFGVPGYAPDQAWLRYQRDGAAWRPCAVLIGHMTENINRIVNRFRPFYNTAAPTMAKPRYILEDGQPALLANPARSVEDLRDPAWAEANLGPRDDWYFPYTYVAHPLDRLELVRLARTAWWRNGRRERASWNRGWAERIYRPETEASRVLTALLIRFAEQVRGDGATPIIVIFPWSAEVNAVRSDGRKPHAPLLDALERRRIPTIDLTDALTEEARGSRLPDLVRTHYTPLGNAVVARTLAERLPDLTAGTCRVG